MPHGRFVPFDSGTNAAHVCHRPQTTQSPSQSAPTDQMRLPLTPTPPQKEMGAATRAAYEDFFNSPSSTPASQAPSTPKKNGNATQVAWFIAGVLFVLLCVYSCS